MQQSTSFIIPVSTDGETDAYRERNHDALDVLLNTGWRIISAHPVATQRQLVLCLLLVRGEPLPYPGGESEADKVVSVG